MCCMCCVCYVSADGLVGAKVVGRLGHYPKCFGSEPNDDGSRQLPQIGGPLTHSGFDPVVFLSVIHSDGPSWWATLEIGERGGILTHNHPPNMFTDTNPKAPTVWLLFSLSYPLKIGAGCYCFCISSFHDSIIARISTDRPIRFLCGTVSWEIVQALSIPMLQGSHGMIRWSISGPSTTHRLDGNHLLLRRTFSGSFFPFGVLRSNFSASFGLVACRNRRCAFDLIGIKLDEGAV